MGTDELVDGIQVLLREDVSRDVTVEALEALAGLIETGPEALGLVMTGRAEQGVGDPA